MFEYLHKMIDKNPVHRITIECDSYAYDKATILHMDNIGIVFVADDFTYCTPWASITFIEIDE